MHKAEAREHASWMQNHPRGKLMRPNKLGLVSLIEVIEVLLTPTSSNSLSARSETDNVSKALSSVRRLTLVAGIVLICSHAHAAQASPQQIAALQQQMQALQSQLRSDTGPVVTAIQNQINTVTQSLNSQVTNLNSTIAQLDALLASSGIHGLSSVSPIQPLSAKQQLYLAAKTQVKNDAANGAASQVQLAQDQAALAAAAISYYNSGENGVTTQVLADADTAALAAAAIVSNKSFATNNPQVAASVSATLSTVASDSNFAQAYTGDAEKIEIQATYAVTVASATSPNDSSVTSAKTTVLNSNSTLETNSSVIAFDQANGTNLAGDVSTTQTAAANQGDTGVVVTVGTSINPTVVSPSQ